MHTRTRGGGKEKADGKTGKNGGNKFAAVMEATPSDGRAYSTDSSESLSPSLSLVRSLQTKSGGVGGSGVGGGVSLLERVIFFFQRGERRTVMCAELMTKGPFMCSVCR